MSNKTQWQCDKIQYQLTHPNKISKSRIKDIYQKTITCDIINPFPNFPKFPFSTLQLYLVDLHLIELHQETPITSPIPH